MYVLKMMNFVGQDALHRSGLLCCVCDFVNTANVEHVEHVEQSHTRGGENNLDGVLVLRQALLTVIEGIQGPPGKVIKGIQQAREEVLGKRCDCSRRILISH